LRKSSHNIHKCPHVPNSIFRSGSKVDWKWRDAMWSGAVVERIGRGRLQNK